ncbi:transglutaminase domain-containing protein [Micrococcales bacterium 31B]|nr:transglutaminase domain-containing protein [Micrococcales bacterium 31B]
MTTNPTLVNAAHVPSAATLKSPQGAPQAPGARWRAIRRDLARTAIAAFAAWAVVYSLHPIIEVTWLNSAHGMIALVLAAGALVRLALALAAPFARSWLRVLLTVPVQLFVIAMVLPGVAPLTPNVVLPANWNPSAVAEFIEPVRLDIATGRVPLVILGNTLALATLGVAVLTAWIDATYVSLRAVALSLLPILGVVIASGLFTPLNPDPTIFAVATLACGLMFLVDVATRPTRHQRVPRASGSTRRFRADARALGTVSTLLVGVVAIGVAVAGGALSSRTETIGSPSFAFDVTQYGQVAGGSMLDNSVNVSSQLRDPVEREVFTFATDTANADNYVRVGVLSLYQNYTWRQVGDEFDADLSQASDGLTAQPPAPYTGQNVTYTFIDVGAQNRYLPVPAGVESAQMLEGSGEWGYNAFGQVLKFQSASNRGLSYEVTSRAEVADPSAWSMQTSSSALTSSVPTLLRTVSDEVTSGAETKLDKALALQNYFRGFRYNINYTSPEDTDPITGFLQSGEGYCEQFSSVMALMAQYEGIEARVVVGYLGQPDANGNVVVTNHNAHAWPELNMGTTENPQWVRFEPTPAGPTGSYSSPSWQDQLNGPPPGSTPEPSATPSETSSSATPEPSDSTSSATPSASASSALTDPAEGAAPAPGTAASADAVATPSVMERVTGWFEGLSLPARLAAAALALLVLAIGALHLPHAWSRGRRAWQQRQHFAAMGDAATTPLPSRAALEAAYAEVGAVASDRGFGWPAGTAPSETLQAATRALGERGLTLGDELHSDWGALVDALNERRYRDPGVVGAVTTLTKHVPLAQVVHTLDRETRALRPRARVAQKLWARLRRGSKQESV